MASSALLAQSSSEYQLANRLMQQQRFADALPILQNLVEEEPQTFAYTDRLIDCLIQLKQYDKGLEAANNFRKHPEYSNQVKIRLGELYHFKGEKEKAIDIWLTNLDEHSNQLQLYVNTARTMLERREYSQAVSVYKKARSVFKNPRLFFSDIANAYLQAGEYEQAIQEWLSLLKDSPGQISFIQRSLLRYDDPILYDIIIIELEERLSRISVSNTEYEPFYQLQIWLLQENKLFRRALATAKAYESKSSTFNYSLFNLGRQLNNNDQFELAREAFSFYIENSYGEVRWRSLEELSNTYSKWAKFISDHNLDFDNQSDSLFHLSFSTLDSILSETKNYSRINNVHLKKAELSLDLIFNLEAAEDAYNQLNKKSDMQDSPDLTYLLGRIHLAKKEFSRARINFTKANKKAGTGELSEKTRYFLALTDFYSGDYEFATIQLKSLGRKNTSYYANDAMELRLWLQEGLSIDSTGTELSRFAEAVFKDKNGEPEESSAMFLDIISRPDFSHLKDDAILFFVNSSDISDTAKLAELSSFIATNPITPLKEKLLWQQAKIAERTNLKVDIKNCQTPDNCIMKSSSSNSTVSARDIYEELILAFPQGFYAPYARERLSELTQENS
ncbi:MAG: tetratricopeptide repeat protein [Balneolaceae bacterium]